MLGLLALGGVDGCGSRSPLFLSTEEAVAGAGETGGSGGSLDGGTGGTGYGGVGAGVGGTGTGGTYPMSTGGVGYGGSYPSAGFGGTGMSVGGTDPLGGTGGKGMGAGGKGIGAGGKGMGAGGKGGGNGDPRVYRSCFLACDKYDEYCPGLAEDCIDSCVALSTLYQSCSRELADYLDCINVEFNPVADCNPADCSGEGCLIEAQQACEGYLLRFTSCIASEQPCATVEGISEASCHLQSFCGSALYETSCAALDQAGTTFDCTCTALDATGRAILEERSLESACHDMSDLCGFPSVR